MKKELVISIVVGSVIGLGIAGLLWYQQRNAAPATDTSDAQEIQIASAPTVEFVEWRDPAGFAFEYPTDVVINKHDEDTVNYAHLELTHDSHPGSIFIWAKDTTAADATAWIKTDKEYKTLSAIDTTLGGVAAKKVLVASVPSKTVTGTVSDAILFTVEGTFDDKEYWEPLYDQIVSSFAFIPLDSIGANESGGAAAPVEESSVDEEEVIQ